MLVVTTDMGCADSLTVMVQVAAPPRITLVATDTSICQGGSVCLSQSALADTLWTNSMLAGPLEDFPHVSSFALEINQFEEGELLADTGRIASICVDMEHSYLGDFVVTMQCPNGQSMMLHEQGGGSTYLGSPNDWDEGAPVPGICWHYCWSPTTMNGTWVDNATGGTLPSGTYQSDRAFSNLLGCPLNGTWTIAFSDLWGADNGFLCAWQLNFIDGPAAPSSLPISIAPSLGSGCDSISWSGPSILSTNELCTSICSGPLHDPSIYVLTVIDEFGCSFSSDMAIDVTIPPIIEGNIHPIVGALESYSIPWTDGVFIWSVEGGSISNGQGTPEVTVLWSLPANGSIKLVHTSDECIDTLLLEMHSDVGVTELASSVWAVHPIPADDRLTAIPPDGWPTICSWRITDMVGRAMGGGVLTPGTSRAFTIGTGMLPDGGYLLELSHEGRRLARPIIIQH
ncbi:MAG: proprotein convertase P-domain-containing protein [Bacteroidetes bacterium]|nr:proprotein convertase P-domain-containing protein [Bacteroidota bacterium]